MATQSLRWWKKREQAGRLDVQSECLSLVRCMKLGYKAAVTPIATSRNRLYADVRTRTGRETHRSDAPMQFGIPSLTTSSETYIKAVIL